MQVEGYPYEPMLLTVHRQELGSNPVCNIRLFRRRDVMFPDCQHYEGVGIPGSQAFALAELTPPLRLNQLQREEGGTRILLQGYTPVSLVRQRFCMGTGKNRELFVITRQDDDGSYFTDHYFQTGFRKGAIILRAYGAVCSADGSFSIPVPAGVTEKIQGVQYVDEEVRQWGCLCATVHK